MSCFLRIVLQSEAHAQSYHSGPEAFSSYAQSLLPSSLVRSSLIALQKGALPFGDLWLRVWHHQENALKNIFMFSSFFLGPNSGQEYHFWSWLRKPCPFQAYIEAGHSLGLLALVSPSPDQPKKSHLSKDINIESLQGALLHGQTCRVFRTSQCSAFRICIFHAANFKKGSSGVREHKRMVMEPISGTL